MPSSMNRSLPATTIAGANLSPHFTSIINSIMNAKVEHLGSKLCSKIKTMKSYFMDKLQSFKNKISVSQNNNSISNIKEKTPLENKIKLSKIENKLLKYDNSNIQNFIGNT